MAKSKESNGSQIESDVDVDDSYNSHNTTTNNAASLAGITTATPTMMSDPSPSNVKRVLITPSSSMPATSQPPSTSATTKDDSYSSKYKRLRRDRERARRGTSKLCTIKPSDLEELKKAANNNDMNKRFMRVIAPIDGWLYSGQLSIDDSSRVAGGSLQYVVKLDGDATGSSYLFTQDTILNDVIKEVRVKTVSELRKGARICCFWSRQYKCLSTGVVTSRTFEATKSLVSVKYDNGALSALPLEDLRLLPPDYPKYMSNCDPLLLARNGEGAHTTNSSLSNINNLVQNNNSASAIQIRSELPEAIANTSNSPQMKLETNNTDNNSIMNINLAEKSQIISGASNNIANNICSPEKKHNFLNSDGQERMTADEKHFDGEEDYVDRTSNHNDDDEEDDDDDEDATIPPTDETIDFITSDGSPKTHELSSYIDRVPISKDNITMANEAQLANTGNSRVSSDENNYGIEYRPWKFDGPPRRSKRHGRTYRDNYSMIRRGNEVIRIGDSAELMPRDETILPFIAKIDGLWATGRGEMRVRVRWYYRLAETEGLPFELKDGDNALFETDHFDENDVQSIYRSTKILSWTEYSQNHLNHVNKNNGAMPKIFYLAGYYDPVRRVKHLRSDVKETQS